MSRISRFCNQVCRLGFQAFFVFRWEGVRGLLQPLRRLAKRWWRGPIGAEARVNDYEPGLVSVAIITKNRLDLIKPCLESLDEHRGIKYRMEILLGDTGTTDLEVLAYYREALRRYPHLKIIRFRRYFFCQNCNRLINRHARGQYLVLLNNDTVVTPGWLEALVDPLEDKSVGLVGAKLLFADRSIQSAGTFFIDEKRSKHAFAGEAADYPPALIPAWVPSVTGACVALRHDVYDRFQLSEDFREECMDPDLCLRLREAGFKVLYEPRSVVYHLHMASRRRNPRGAQDNSTFHSRWRTVIQKILAQERQRLPVSEDDPAPVITVIREDGVGDLLMGVGAFKKLRENHPQARLVLATYARNIKMMAGFKIFDDFIPIPDGQRDAPLPLPRAAREYDLRKHEVNSEYAWGFWVGSQSTADNQAHRHTLFCREFGVDDRFEPLPMPDFPEDRERVRELLGQKGLSPEMPLVVVNLLASNPGRSWWEPFFPAMLAALEESGFIPVITGTRDSPFFRGRRVVNLVNQTPAVTEYVELVKMGRYVISTDTGACHIAALAGIPLLAIFTGGVRPEARLNLYEKVEVVAPPESLPCYPCWDEGCRRLGALWLGEPCRRAVTPGMVMAGFRRLVRRYPPQGGRAS